MDADYTGIKSICDKVEFENDGALFVINKNEEMVYEKMICQKADYGKN